MNRVLTVAVLASIAVAALVFRQAAVRDSTAAIFLLGLLAGIGLTAAALLAYREISERRQALPRN